MSVTEKKAVNLLNSQLRFEAQVKTYSNLELCYKGSCSALGFLRLGDR